MKAIHLLKDYKGYPKGSNITVRSNVADKLIKNKAARIQTGNESKIEKDLVSKASN